VRQPLLSGVEQLIDEVLFDADVLGKHVGDGVIGQFVSLMELAQHFPLPHDDQGARRDRGGRA
jgi:hypothetical protein